MTLKELEKDLKQLREEGATDSTPVKFAMGPGQEAELLSLYYSSERSGPREIWFDVESV